MAANLLREAVLSSEFKLKIEIVRTHLIPGPQNFVTRWFAV